MTEANKTTCPTCNGKKVIEGTCECDMEWRGSKTGDEWQDCQCTPDQPCPTCSGTGFIEQEG